MAIRKTCLSDRAFLLSAMAGALERGDFHALGQRLRDPVAVAVFAGPLGLRQAARLEAFHRILRGAEEARASAGLPPFEPVDAVVPRQPALPAAYWTPARIAADIAVYETPEGRKRLKGSLLNRRTYEHLLSVRDRLEAEASALGPGAAGCSQSE